MSKHYFSKLSVIIFLAAFLLVTSFSFVSCSQKEAIRTEFAFDTVCTVNAYEYGTKQLQDTLFARLQVLESLLSAHIPTSDISRINDLAGIAPVVVSEETLFVLKNAYDYAEKTNGAYDPTIGPLVSLWNIKEKQQKYYELLGNADVLEVQDSLVPSTEEITKVLPLVDYTKLHLDFESKTAFLEEKGMKLDVGGIAKGYAADQLVQILRDSNVKQAIVDLGGNVFAMGSKKNGADYRIGIKNPKDPEIKTVVVLKIKNQTVVTSGVYERFFIENGIRYHHILNPKTGYPVQNDLLSYTIVGDSSLVADVLSTACFVLGNEKALELLSSESNFAGLSISNDMTMSVTLNMLQLIDEISEDVIQ